MMFKLLLICIICVSRLVLAASPNWKLHDANEGWKDEFLTLKYFHNSELQRQWAWHLLGKYHFKGNERILDFGCGDGKITAELAHFIPQGSILGVDLAEFMIAFAKRCFPSTQFVNLTFERTKDIDFKNSKEDEYDLICSFCVLHLVPNPIQILNNLRTRLTSEGRLLLVIPSGNNSAFFQAANEMFDKYHLSAPWSSSDTEKNAVTMRTIEGCAHCLSAAGFEPISILSIHGFTAFYNKHELIKWMIGTVAPNWQVPLDKAEIFFSDLVDRMSELDDDVIDKSGAYNMKLSRIEVVARKCKNENK